MFTFFGFVGTVYSLAMIAVGWYLRSKYATFAQLKEAAKAWVRSWFEKSPQ